MGNQFDKYADVVVLEQLLYIKVEKFTKKYYQSLGYVCEVWDIIQIDINHLSDGSHQKLYTQCPRCCLVKQSVCKNIHYNKSTYCVSCKLSRKAANTFEQKANEKHDCKYNYSLVIYKNSKTKVKIICPEHGIFLQKPNDHLSGYGCLECSDSKGESSISSFLRKHNIEHIREWADKRLHNGKLRFDFYIPKFNLFIEYDGKQHFEPVDYFGGEEALKHTQKNDKIKNEWADKNNYKLIRIPYYEDVNDVLTRELLHT